MIRLQDSGVPAQVQAAHQWTATHRHLLRHALG